MKKILFIVAVVLWAGACSSEEIAPVEVEEAVEEGVVTTTSRQIVISPVFTKVSDTTFVENDMIGVTITKLDNTEYATNTALTYSGSTFSGDLTWYDDTTACMIIAYYPYQSDGVPTTFEVQSDQSAGTSTSDFIVGSATDVSPSSEAVSIDFYHLLSRVNVNVTNNSGIGISSVTLAGSYLDAIVDVAEQTVEVDNYDGEIGTITLYEATEGSVYQAIVVPQTVELTLTITMKDGIVKEKTLESKELKSTYEYDVNVTISEYETWYVTDDSRTFPYNNSYCYGAQNTYYVEQYTSESNSITFEVKARVNDESYATGDSLVVSVPKYYKIIIAGDETSYTLLSIDNADDDGYAEVGSNYTITVNVASSSECEGSWGLVGIYDESYNCLWTFMICKYLTDDEVSYIKYTDIGKSIMDRHLGYGVSIAKAIESGTGQTHGTAYFQYGRPTPFPYNQVTSDLKYECNTSTSTISNAISNPTTFYIYTDNTSLGLRNWYYESSNDLSLWGGSRITSPYNGKVTGSKTVYDPCPEGYRVCDDIFFYELNNSGTALYDSLALNNCSSYLSTNSSSPLTNQSVYKYNYDSSDSTKVDYWTYTGIIGLLNSTSTNYSAGTGKYSSLYGAIAYWCSSPLSTDQAVCFAYVNYSSAQTKYTNYYKNRGLAVRCQVEDTE